MNESTSSAQGGSFGWVKWCAAGMFVLVVGIILLPTILCRTGLLQSVVNGQLRPLDIEFNIDSAQIGWTRPTRFKQLEIRDVGGTWDVSAKEVYGSRNLWQLLFHRDDLGSFLIDEPQVIVDATRPIVIPDLPAAEETEAEPGEASDQTLRIEIHNGTILVRVPDREEPVEFVSHINIQAQWTKSGESAMLKVEPGKAIERVALTPEMCDLGLKYVAPVLADVAWTEGELSLDLDECVVLVDRPQQSRVRGRVGLNSVRTGLRSPVAKNVAQLIATATNRQLPESVKLAEDSTIDFQVENQQVHHSGLAFGLPELSPELVIRTEGTVGFDKQLDLLATVPIPLSLLGDGPIATAIGDRSLELPIQGTLDAPQVKFDVQQDLLGNILSGVLDPEKNEESLQVDDVLQVLRGLREQRQRRREQGEQADGEEPSERAPLLPRLRDRLRRER